MKVLLDANVIISALVADGLCRALVLKCHESHTILTSPQILGEVTRKLKSKFRLGQASIQFLEAFENHATVVSPQPLSAPVCRDPDDDWILAAAQQGQADAIITGDGDLLVLRKFQNVPILAPRDFLNLVFNQAK